MWTKKEYIKMLEAKQYLDTELVFVHYPITEDVVQCRIAQQTKDKLLLTFDENSDYFGAPAFWFKKVNVIGKVQSSV